MNKKKPKRVDVRSVMDKLSAARRQKFYTSGAPVSLLFLAIFVIISSFILIWNKNTLNGLWYRQPDTFRPLLLTAALMFVISSVMGLYVAAYQPRIVKNHLRGGILLTTLIIMIALIRIGVLYPFIPAYLIIVPVLILAVMMTIAYSQRFALGLTSFLILIAALSQFENHDFNQQSFAVLFTTGIGMCITILLLKGIRTRSKLIEVCSISGFVIFVMAWLTGWWLQESTNADINISNTKILTNSAWAGGSALAIGFIMQGLLPFIEKLFRTATSLTLLDYGEATKPLLERLAMEAPGTFNHSWQIGMLAESGANAIGANGLLCRVGSYYHDVGKLNKPRYFVENQGERLNQHKELSPTMSRMIIVGHVKDGLELAREYKLPRVLHQFIATHHGTTLVEYFYHEATKQENANDSSIAETDFRYPGPKPSTKEAAIVMLTDAVESATRAMQDPTPNRIENIVHEVGQKRLQDGQFDDCDLTMRELKLIEESLIKSLCGMYHGRIAYPKQEKNGKKKSTPPVKSGV